MTIGVTVYNEKRKPPEDQIANSDKWFKLAKNIFWVGALLMTATWKVSAIDNVNTNQSEQIAKAKEDIKEVQRDINTIKEAQSTQLVILARIQTLAEINARNQEPHKGR